MSHQATETQSLAAARAQLPEMQAHLDKILARLRPLREIGPGSKVLDVGAGQGLLLICCARRGLQAVGVEPWDAAREVAVQLAHEEGVDIDIRQGAAEKLPFADCSFDFVHAQSVIEHVADPAEAFCQVRRVLKDGGVFWFSAASSLCPRQKEISGFPCFGWYPDRLKRRIMRWARDSHPRLIGNTAAPAINWFTPRKARRMLAEAGFREVYDRWQLRRPEEGGRAQRAAMRMIQTFACARFVADVCVTACSYAGIK